MGSTESLSARYDGAYEVYFTCRTRDEVVKARALTRMAFIPGSRMADDVATRFEVLIESENGVSLGQLLNVIQP